MFLPLHNEETVKQVQLITYQCLCEWVFVFILGAILVDLYHIFVT